MHLKLNSLFSPRSRVGSRGEEIFIIAEIGKNFIQTAEDRPVDEYLANAKHLIDEAACAGADAVKFQTHEVSDEQAKLQIVSPHFPLADRYRWLERNTQATPLGFWQELKEYAEKQGLIFFSTPMSRGAALKLESLALPLWKVGSGDVQDFLLLDYLRSTNKPVIISSGMVSLAELEVVMKRLKDYAPGVGLLYCVSQYPCPPELFNLATLQRFQAEYPGVTIGFSDHSLADHRPVLAAIKLGARIIEKHFSLSRELWGPDHKASLTPAEFGDMVTLVRGNAYHSVDLTPWLGSQERELEGACNQYRPYFHKTLVAGSNLETGQVLMARDLHALRPRMHLEGLAASALDEVVGRTLRQSLKAHEPITLELLN